MLNIGQAEIHIPTKYKDKKDKDKKDKEKDKT